MRIATLLLALCVSISSMGQYCGTSGSNICSTDSSLTAAGITSFTSFPCVTKGVNFNSTFQLYFPSTYSSFTIDSVHIDSITNLPCGMCWSNDNPSMMYVGGQRGCVNISGTTNDSVGAYNIGLYGTVYLTFGSNQFSTGGSLSQYWSSFYVFVINPGDPCTHVVPAQTLTACNGGTCSISNVSIQQLNTTGCHFDTVKLGANASYATYEWVINSDTFHTSSINVVQPGGYTQLYVTDTAHCRGAAFTSVYGASGPVNTPTVCYVSSDTSLTQTNMIVAFEKDNYYNNIADYILIGIDTSGNRYPFTKLSSVSAAGYFRDSSITYSSYYVAAATSCGDTTFSLYTYAPSILTVDTTGGYPNLSWHLQYPYNYSAIKVWGRAPGHNWQIKDTIYSNNLVSMLLSYTDMAPDSSLMEYMLSYDITGTCDPNRSAVTAFTNRAKTYTSAGQQPSSISSISGTQGMTVYPNPAFDHLTVTMPKDVAVTGARIKVYDMIGDLIQDNAIEADGKKVLDISSYAKGIYILKAIKDDGSLFSIKKFTKE